MRAINSSWQLSQSHVSARSSPAKNRKLPVRCITIHSKTFGCRLSCHSKTSSLALMRTGESIKGLTNPLPYKVREERPFSKPYNPALTQTRTTTMATSNSTPYPTEFKAYDLFPLSPDLAPVPTIFQLQQQVDEANLEVAEVKHQLSAVKAQMLVSVEESVMVAEAHLEQRLEKMLEEVEERMIMRLDKEVDVRLKVEFAFVTAFVMFVSVVGGFILRAFGY